MDKDSLAQQLDSLVALDRKIDGAEGDAIRVRWEFGRELLSRRVGRKLPVGLLDGVCAATGKSRQEIQSRMRFAEKFPTEDALSDAVRQWRSWHHITHDALVHEHRQHRVHPDTGPVQGSPRKSIRPSARGSRDPGIFRSAGEIANLLVMLTFDVRRSRARLVEAGTDEWTDLMSAARDLLKELGSASEAARVVRADREGLEDVIVTPGPSTDETPAMAAMPA